MKDVEPGSCAYQSTSRLREGCVRHDVGQCVSQCAPGVVAAAVIILSLVLPYSATAAESNDAIMAQIMRDWKARRTAMARVHYVIKGTRTTRKGMMTDYVIGLIGKADGEIPPHDQVDDVSVDMLIDFERQWYRIEAYEPPRPGLGNLELGSQVSRDLRCGNGEVSQRWYPDMKDQHVQLYMSARRKGAGIRLVPKHYPICYAHGFVHPSRQLISRRVPLDPTAFTVHSVTGRGANKQVVLRAHSNRDSWEEWWVDLGRQSAVTKHVVYFDATHRSLAIHIEYQKTEKGWLPSTWRVQRFEFDDANEVCWFLTFHVEKIEIDPPVTDSMFHKKLEPGMVVRDSTTDRIYVVAKDGTPGPDFASVRRTRAIREARAEDKQRRRWRWMPVLMVGVVFCSGALFLWLRRRGGR